MLNIPLLDSRQRGIDVYTVLMLHMDGADGATTFRDSSAYEHSVTANGNAQIDTAQSAFYQDAAAASGLFDGTGDYLRPASHVDFAFGTGDLTVDFWVRFSSLAAALDYLYKVGSSNFGIYVQGSVVKFQPTASTTITGTTTLSTGVWYHVALVRRSGSTKLYLNGVQEGSTYTDSNNYGTSAVSPYIACQDGPSWYLHGWLDELRISKGIARWRENFTPPARAYSG